MPRIIVLRGAASALRGRPELVVGPGDIGVELSGEVAWEGVRRLIAGLARRDGAAVMAALAPHRAAVSLVLRGLSPQLSDDERGRRDRLAAQAPGYMAHNGLVSYPLRAAWIEVLAPLLRGRRVVVTYAEALDLPSASVLARLPTLVPDLELVFACDPARLPADPLRRREGLTVLSLLGDRAASEIGAAIAVEDGGSDMSLEPVAFEPGAWDDDLELRGRAAVAGGGDPAVACAALEACWACYGFHACLELGLALARRGEELSPAARRRVHLLVALSAYNRQVGSRGESPAADEELALLLDEHLRAALDGEDDLEARSHILYRLAINHGRRRGDLPAALGLADAAVAAAEQAGAPFFAAWARNGRAYVVGRLGELERAIGDVAAADELAGAPLAGPLAGEQPMTRVVLADNLAALHAWARRPREALRWQAVCQERAAALGLRVFPSPRWIELHTALGELETAARAAEDGLRLAEELMSPTDADLFSTWLGELRYRQGDAAAARRLFTRARALAGRLGADHRDLPTRIAAALAAARGGDLAAAEDEFAAIVERDPAPELVAQWGVIAARRGDREQADARINAAIAEAVARGERDELLRVAVAAGEACLALGDREQAADALRQALALATDDPPAQPVDLLAAVATAGAAGIVETGPIDQVLAVLDAALDDAESWWQLGRLAAAHAASGSTADASLLRARLAQRGDAPGS